MKTIVDSWHSGIDGVRLAGKFAAATHELREADGPVDYGEEAARVVALASKITKSPGRALAALEEVEARLSSTIGYRPRTNFDRAKPALCLAERDRLLTLVMDSPVADQIQLPKRVTQALRFGLTTCKYFH